MGIISEKVKNDHYEYRANLNRYLNKEIDDAGFRAIRVQFGIYEERNNLGFMIRAKVNSGIITPKQLKKIVELAKKYSHGEIHFTTRQDIQFHQTKLENSADIVEELFEAGIVTRGSGGNTPRNISLSLFAGVDKEEPFDVTPYALEASEYLAEDEINYHLPRKYKIAFSNSNLDTAYAKISDLGFIPVIKNGEKGFKVYVAGGLGNSSSPSIVATDFIPADSYIYYVKGVRDLFHNHGDRANKARARIRHILQKVGEEEFRKLLAQYVREAEKAGIPYSNREEIKYITKEGKESKRAGKDIKSSKVKNRYSIHFHNINGNTEVTDIEEVLKVIDGLDYTPSIRLTNSQGFYVREIDGKDIDKFKAVKKKRFTNDTIDRIVACTGASTCKLGLCFSQMLSKAITERFKKESSLVRNALHGIHISGCPNSCGQHHIGKIGFFGKAKRVGENLVPFYAIVVNGSLAGETAKLAEQIGEIPAKSVPNFLVEVAEKKIANGEKDLEKYLLNNRDELKNLIEKWAKVPTIEENPDYYSDFGQNEHFSLKGRGPGEEY